MKRSTKIWIAVVALALTAFVGAGAKGEAALSSRYYADTFDKWVVLELPDKRHAFLPPNAIAAFEEARVPMAKKSAAKSVGNRTPQ